jgi:hypothetical protein
MVYNFVEEGKLAKSSHEENFDFLGVFSKGGPSEPKKWFT